MQYDWGPWTNVAGGFTAPGGPVTLIRWGEWPFAVFVSGTDGTIYTTAGGPKNPFPGGWAAIPGIQVPPGAAVTAAPWGEWPIALFVNASDGQMYTTAGNPQNGFPGGWASVAVNQVPGAVVTVLPWGDWPFAVFFTAADGGIYTTAGGPENGFPGGWASVAGGQAPPGAPVTVVPWGDWPFAVFVTGTDGGLYTTAGNPQDGFPGGWASVAGGQAAPGAPVTVEPWKNQFAVFVTGTDGQIWTTAGDPQSGFRSWVPIPGISAAPGTPITAVFDGERFAVIAADAYGNVYAAFGTIDDGFTSWARVSEGTTIPGGHNTGFWNFDGSQMSVFLADQSGGIYVTGTVPPFAPTNLHVTSVTNTTIGIAWVDNSGDQDGFRVSYSGGNSFNLPPGDRTANITGLQSGKTYEISVLAFNDVTGISPSSNVITVTTGVAPQTVQMTLNRQIIIAGPVPYAGTFPPFGTTQPFHLQQISVPSNSDVLALRFVKSGHSSEQCGDDNAVVTVAAGSSTTPTELKAIFGVTTYPINFTNGLSLVACVAQPTGAPLLNFINVELTLIFG